MTITEAKKICLDHHRNTERSADDEFMYTEALKYLVEETKSPSYMLELGGYYYGNRYFDLALKYYELAAEYNNVDAISALGYIWYYGRTGEKNYEKAFYYFDKARGMGDTVAAYKVADMYKNGFFVEKDYEKYKSIIEELYPAVRKESMLWEPLPEVFTRLAAIRAEEGRTDEALDLYDRARDFLSQRIRCGSFFGDLSIMKWMIESIYKLREFDPDAVGLYDLYYIFRSPAKVSFFFEDRMHEAEASEEEDGIAVRFDDKWYRNVDDFFAKAKLNGESLTMRYEELYGFEVK